MMEMERGSRKTRLGVVVSDKMDKTRIVEVTRTFRHSLYKKVMHHRKKYYVHDDKNQSQAGDKVRIMESRPLSKLKRWYLVEVIKKAS